jgi:hypothetical protein
MHWPSVSGFFQLMIDDPGKDGQLQSFLERPE